MTDNLTKAGDGGIADCFGGCPTCQRNDGFLNVHANHWFICHTHKVKWCYGFNQFACWKCQAEEEWAANHALLMTYTQVEPAYPEAEEEARK